MLAKLHEELTRSEALGSAAEYVRRFLESPQKVADQQFAWNELARIYQALGDWTAAGQAQIRRCKLPDTPYSTLSNTANWLNSLLRENYVALDSEEKRVLYRELAELMGRRASEATATDLSRLAWLYLHLRDVPRAKEAVERGLAIDPGNEHCVRLKRRLGESEFSES